MFSSRGHRKRALTTKLILQFGVFLTILGAILHIHEVGAQQGGQSQGQGQSKLSTADLVRGFQGLGLANFEPNGPVAIGQAGTNGTLTISDGRKGGNVWAIGAQPTCEEFTIKIKSKETKPTVVKLLKENGFLCSHD